jgi:branched-chain amino acid transport system ATP-binding protein
LSLEVAKGEIVTLIGSNGAGKSTTLLALSGLLQPSGGTLEFDGKDLRTVPAHFAFRPGWYRCPKDGASFPRFPLREICAGRLHAARQSGISGDLEEIYELFHACASAVSGSGHDVGRRAAMLAVGRAMMSRSRLLLLDEPSLGLAPLLVKENFNVIKRIRDRGVTVLLVDKTRTCRWRFPIALMFWKPVAS